MPPDGYETVTLPKALVERIDEHAEQIGVDSRTAALRNLIAEAETSDNTESVELDRGTITDIANETSNQVVRELESTLR